jgi:hypothetical protein
MHLFQLHVSGVITRTLAAASTVTAIVGAGKRHWNFCPGVPEAIGMVRSFLWD